MTPFDHMVYSYLSQEGPKTELLLVRHGQQWLPGPGEAYEGHRNPALSETGKEQARAVGLGLAAHTLDAVYASPLTRAHATAEAIGGHHGLEPVVLEDLREIDLFRELEPGISAEDFLGPIQMQGVRERMMHERSWDVYPASESSAEFRRRVANTIEGIASNHENQRVAIVCHGGVINSYLAHVLGIGRDMFFMPAHTSVSTVLAAPYGVRAPRTIGDVSHLAHRRDLVTF
ncbi:histidine phosphatase family protein [Nocardioides terrisoli]|uniref:histidine phosphatase family protein n=1 Tax=Nocardioides terrisoli TaxID=3388267 RepID=UPI00287B5C10|nr:histidine phosphatase family protein [Nocardioides marmorisolisilvae]